MMLILPFLSIYVEELGVQGQAAISQWSGIIYGATFVTAGLVAPLWGYLGDRYGRKPMLLRASLGLGITMSLMGLSTNIWHLLGLRLLAGVAGGYVSGAMILVAVQTPRERSAWALGVLSSGVMTANIIGPLAGGLVPPLIGIRATFWGAAFLIFATFLATAVLVKETHRKEVAATVARRRSGWSEIPHKNIVVAMLATGFLLMVANMSIEPIITIYVGTLIEDQSQATFIAGLVLSATALGSVLSASSLGKLADRIGHSAVIVAALMIAALLLIPQAFVTAGWQLVLLRFLMGVALGGLLPCIAAVVRHSVPDQFAGTILGYSVSSQYIGQVAGSFFGGFVAGHVGVWAVFLLTAMFLWLGAVYNWFSTDLRSGS